MSLLVLRKQRKEKGPYSKSTIRDIKDDEREDAGEKRIKEGRNREEGSFWSQKTETGERTEHYVSAFFLMIFDVSFLVSYHFSLIRKIYFVFR